MQPVRFGLIGYGAWGSHHARALSKTAGAELVAIAAHSSASCDRARSDHPSSRVYSDYAEMLRQENLDAVDVVLPAYLHFEASRAVLESGRHLLLEKPMALTLAECDALIGLGHSCKKVLAVGHEMRLSALWGKVKAMIDAGAVGRPLYVHVELWRRPYRPGSGGWRYDIQRVGNWVLEEPIHFFDLARWYLSGLGPPQTVYARANSKQPGHPELCDNFTAVLGFPGGAYAVISQTLAAFEHHQVVKLTGTAGAIWAAWSGAMDRTLQPTHSLKHLDANGQLTDVPLHRPSGEVFELEDEMAMMVQAMRDGRPVACSGEDGRWSVALCLAAQRSVETGAIVKLDDFGIRAEPEA